MNIPIRIFARAGKRCRAGGQFRPSDQLVLAKYLVDPSSVSRRKRRVKLDADACALYAGNTQSTITEIVWEKCRRRVIPNTAKNRWCAPFPMNRKADEIQD